MPADFDPSRAAVLSMDNQHALVSIYAKPPEPYLEACAAVLRRAREAGMKVIHVQIGFRPNLPEVSSRNLLLAAIKASPQHQKIFEGAAGAIHPALAPEADDIVVTKRRVNAFAGTDLEVVLRANDIDTLFLFGIAISGVVLATLMHACDADYRVSVIKDCCLDNDAEVHASLVEKVFPRYARVIAAADFLSN